MTQRSSANSPDDTSGFAEQAEGKQTGLLREFWDFLKHNKKWWLVPIVFVILLLGAFVILGSTAPFPFIYTFF